MNSWTPSWAFTPLEGTNLFYLSHEFELDARLDYKFVIDGKPATVSDLKAGQKISATKIVEEPLTEFYTDAVVTGTVAK